MQTAVLLRWENGVSSVPCAGWITAKEAFVLDHCDAELRILHVLSSSLRGLDAVFAFPAGFWLDVLFVLGRTTEFSDPDVGRSGGSLAEDAESLRFGGRRIGFGADSVDSGAASTVSWRPSRTVSVSS